MQRAVGTAAFLAGCVGILSMPCPAFAQETSKVQAGGGYMYVADPWVAFTNSVSTESGAGWFAKIVGNVTPDVGVVGEVSGTYHDALNHRGIKGAARVYGMLGGVRLRPFCCRVAAPFAHVMAGTVQARFTVHDKSLASIFDVDEGHFALALGGGVDVGGVHVVTDFMRVHHHSDYAPWTLRIAAGVMLPRR